MKKLNYEKRFPIVLAFIVAGAGCIATWIGIIPSITQTMLSSGMTIGAIFAGFDGVHKSLLVGLNTPSLRQMKKTAYYDDILQYMASNLYWSLWFVIASFIFQWILDSSQWKQIQQREQLMLILTISINTIWLFLGSGMCASFARVNKIFTIFIRQHKTY
ncbi:MAG: hypothetical protein LUE13_02475 [Akkermansiaceae bacterium]|nr:hypothetical protein [Akkermansiaceae bacterium]